MHALWVETLWRVDAKTLAAQRVSGGLMLLSRRHGSAVGALLALLALRGVRLPLTDRRSVKRSCRWIRAKRANDCCGCQLTASARQATRAFQGAGCSVPRTH